MAALEQSSHLRLAPNFSPICGWTLSLGQKNKCATRTVDGWITRVHQD